MEERAAELLPQSRAPTRFVWMDEHTLYAARDPQGIRPLVLGRLERGWVVASETAALDIVGASFVREIEPGEMVAVDEQGLRTRSFAEPTPKGCLFEFVYLARPDTTHHRPRGAQRARRDRPPAGPGVPRRRRPGHPGARVRHPAGDRYAEESGIPYGMGLVKNSYVGRTFIQPSQTIRQLGIRLKLNPLRDVIEGKRLVVVDDSIVRGNTQRALVRMLREAGAREVHVRISSPAGQVAVLLRHRLRHPRRADRQRPDVRGDLPLASTPTRSATSASTTSIEATTVPMDDLCRACFDGVYPIPLPEPERLGKGILEAPADRVALPVLNNP